MGTLPQPCGAGRYRGRAGRAVPAPWLLLGAAVAGQLRSSAVPRAASAAALTPGSHLGLRLSRGRGLPAALGLQPARQVVGKSAGRLTGPGDRAVPVTAWLGTGGAVAAPAP